MYGSALIPLVTAVVHIFLLTMIMRDMRTRTRRLLAVYLIASASWGLSSFLLHASFLPEQLSLWEILVPMTGLWAVVGYSQFICAFTKRHVTAWIVLGYAFLATLITLAATGYIPRSLTYASGGEIDIYQGTWLYLMIGGSVWFTGLSIFYLVQKYHASKDVLTRNRVAYLLIGASLFAVFSAIIAVPALFKYPIEHIGHLANAAIITYVVLRYKLLDIKLVARKGLTYSSISVFITSLYLLMLWSLRYFLQGWTSPASLATIFAMTFVVVSLFNPLRMRVQRTVDKMFYGKSYYYRQSVASFAQRMGAVLDLNTLAEEMVKPIPAAVNASQVSLLLSNNGDFTSQFDKRIIGGQQAIPIQLSHGSPIMRWLVNTFSPKSQSYEIKHDPSVGFYLYVFEGNKCIRDHLQDTLEMAMECAWEDYGVPKSAWKKIED